MVSRMFRLALVLVVIAGCSAEPGASDIQNALESRMRRELTDAQDKVRNLGGAQSVRSMHAFGAVKPQDLHIEHVEILTSEMLDNGAYDVRIRFDTRAGEHYNTATANLIMQRTRDGWNARLPP